MNNEYDNLDWINSREMNRPKARPPIPPKVDEEVSQIVGKKILINDPKLIKLLVKWKRAKTDPDEMDNFLQDGSKVRELRETFNPERFKEKENAANKI